MSSLSRRPRSPAQVVAPPRGRVFLLPSLPLQRGAAFAPEDDAAEYETVLLPAAPTHARQVTLSQTQRLQLSLLWTLSMRAPGVMALLRRLRAATADDEAREPALGVTWRETRKKKLAPVWLLANVIVLFVVGAVALPRLSLVDRQAGCQWHIVGPGESLSTLAREHHLSAEALARANHITPSQTLYFGQQVCLPLLPWTQAKTQPVAAAGARAANVLNPNLQGSLTTVPGSVQGAEPFIAYALPYARRAHEQTGWPVSVILAQWGVEQGWKAPGYTGYNWGNVAALPGEPTVDGIAVPGSPAAFAYANTPELGLQFYVRVAQLDWYSGVAQAAHSGDVAAARALGRSPWDAAHYTDRGDPGSSLVGVMEAFNLYQYD